MKRLFAAALPGVCGHLIDAAELKRATLDVPRVLGDFHNAQEVDITDRVLVQLNSARPSRTVSPTAPSDSRR